WITPVVTPTDIGRPTIATVDASHALFCAPKGPNRPSDSVECALVDGIAGTVVTKNEFFKGGNINGARKYFNQPTIANVDDTHFALLSIASNGMGKNTNVKGANEANMMMIERNGDTLVPGAVIVGAAAHQTHATICTGGYGVQGTPTVGVFSAPP